MEYWKLLRKHLGDQKVIIPSGVGVIKSENKVLLTYHKDLKQWGFPGGLQDLHESIEETVKREIKEELNLDLRVKNLIGVYSNDKWHLTFSNGDTIQILAFLFEMSNNYNEALIQLQPEEIVKYDYFDLDDLPEECSPLTLQQCKDILEYNGTVFIR